MDTSRVIATVDRLLEEDKRTGVSGALQQVANQLGNLAQQPGQPQFQTELRTALDDLTEAVGSMMFASDPTLASYVRALNGERYFSDVMLGEIQSTIDENPMSPAVARDVVQELATERAEFLEALRAFQRGAARMDLSADEVGEGEAQIGFRIPREIFDNRLDGWTSELRQLRLIIAPFSEMATGAPERIEIGEISTTDPIIFLILNPITVAMLGKAVSWSLDQWKKVEEIRKLRADTAKISAGSEGVLDDMVVEYDARINKLIDAQIGAKAALLSAPVVDAGRQNELNNAFVFALKSLVAHVERGMTVEIKYLPSPAGQEEADSPQSAAFNDLAEVLPALVFPPASPAPIVALPKAPKVDDEQGKPAARKRPDPALN